MDTAALPIANKLLASISGESYARLLPHLERVFLRHGETLHEAVGSVDHVHFPTTALLSVFVDTANGASAELVLVGNDGASGLIALLCETRARFRTVVDTDGYAYRVKLEILRKEVARDAAVHRAIYRYLMARMVQMAGNVVCNSHHSVAQRLCRALLMRLERAGGNTLFITHEMMASILGVRRPGVTKAASDLRRAGAIAYKRGYLTVLDNKALHKCACECYGEIKEQNESLKMSSEAAF